MPKSPILPSEVVRRSRPRAALLGSIAALALLVLGAAQAPSARASCFPWKCCDQWGYDYPGTYVTKNGCENNGGEVECGLTCSNATFPFKCCAADGSPIQGIYTSPHECVTSGHTVFSGLLCPNAGPFNCCDSDGDGSAPGVYLTRWQCTDDGYIVQNFDPLGCPGGWWDDIVAKWNEMKNNVLHCAPDTATYYTKPAATSILKGWKDDYLAANPSGVWTDKDDHCITSCLITAKCSKFSALVVGWARETLQMCDGSPKNAWGWGDECANRMGRGFGESVDAGNFEQECVDACTGINDLDTLCAGVIGGLPLGNVPDIGIAAFQGIVDYFAEEVGGVENAWAKVNNKCQECLDDPSSCFSFFGLTLAVDAAQVVASVADLKAQGLALIAAAGPLVEGDIRTTDGGTIMQALPDGETMILVNLPTSQLDVYLTFKDAKLDSLRFRGAEGNDVIMSTADPVTTACSTPPCEKRVPWMQWMASRSGVTP